MKNTIVMVGIASALAVVSNGAHARDVGTNYAGAQYAITTYSEDGISEEPNPTALVGRLGRFFHTNFSLEGRLGIGLQDDTVNVFGVDVTMELDSLIGVYGLGHINITETSSVYGLIGFTQAEATLSAPGFGSESDDESDLSLGIGADIGIGNAASVNIEYAQYLSKSDFDFTAISFGVNFYF
jgi:hypothetical protein